MIPAALVLALCASGGTGSATAAATSAVDLSPYISAQRLVDVGGHKLNLYCTGRGSPTVVLDAGQAGTTFAWHKVQPAIAKFTRVCSFDRAGMGFSEAGPLPRDANAMVTDLHRLLGASQIAPPYVLVGHSIAGLYELLYADRFLPDVAGMVLVDPSFPNQTRSLHAASPTMARMEADAPRADTFCYTAALHGKLSLERGSAAYAICGFPAHAADNLRKGCARNGAAWCRLQRLTLAQYARPSFWAAYRSEDLASATIDSAEDEKEQRTYGALPLTVLTAANDVDAAELPSAEMRAVNRAWNAGHDRLARLSSVGVNRIVRRSEHEIALYQPAVVTAAVADILRQTRRRR